MPLFQFKRNTASGAAGSNPTLAQGEPGFETDTGNLKIGDGSTAWNSLPLWIAAALKNYLATLPTSPSGLSAGDLYLNRGTLSVAYPPFTYIGIAHDTAPANDGEAGSSGPTDGSGYYAFNIFGTDLSGTDQSSTLGSLSDGTTMTVTEVGGGVLGTLTYDAGSSSWAGSYLYFVGHSGEGFDDVSGKVFVLSFS